MNVWQGLHVAHNIAVYGSANKAADNMGLHRTTVIRQLDFLEQQLNRKLFIRHNKGFVLTEAGKSIIQAMEQYELQLKKTIRLLDIHDKEVEGEIVVTSIERAFSFLCEPFESFMESYPNVRLRFKTDIQAARLEHGESHILILPGKKPSNPDYIVQKLFRVELSMYAHARYVEQHGIPTKLEDFCKHRFVMPASGAQISEVGAWIEAIPPQASVFCCDERSLMETAVLKGLGIGFTAKHVAIKNKCMVPILPERSTISVPVWLVTHLDQHRTPKVQAFSKHLKNWVIENIPELRE